MIDQFENPYFLNEFLDFSGTILNKSKNSIKEYNYDIAHFLKFIKFKFRMTDIKDKTKIKTIKIADLEIKTIEKITLEDIHAFLSYLKDVYNSKPATLARKASTIRIFFASIKLPPSYFFTQICEYCTTKSLFNQQLIFAL